MPIAVVAVGLGLMMLMPLPAQVFDVGRHAGGGGELLQRQRCRLLGFGDAGPAVARLPLRFRCTAVVAPLGGSGSRRRPTPGLPLLSLAAPVPTALLPLFAAAATVRTAWLPSLSAAARVSRLPPLLAVAAARCCRAGRRTSASSPCLRRVRDADGGSIVSSSLVLRVDSHGSSSCTAKVQM